MVRKKLVLIQFSRALVPFLVMLFHVSLTMMEYFDFNFLGLSYLPMSGGVNYFFALSGFMIYYIYRKNLGQSNQLKNFLLNRFIRIYPLYWILTLALLPFLFMYPWYGVGHETDIDVIITSFLLFPNPRGIEPIILVAWSLIHTVFFYVIFSLLFFSKVNISKAIIAVWGVLTLVLAFVEIPFDYSLIYFIFDPANLIFLAGILCAYLVTHYTLNIKVSVLLSIIGLLGFPLMWLDSVYQFFNINFDVGTGLASALLILGISSIDLQKDIMIPKVFNYLGNAAFAIYLSHNIVLDFLAEFFERISIFDVLGGWAISIIFLIFMLIGGCLIHSFIEKPLIGKLKQILLKKNTNRNEVGDVLLKKS